MRISFIFYSSILLLILLNGNLVFSQQTTTKNNGDTVNHQAVLDSIYNYILTDYVETASPQKLMRSGIEGMLTTLDPFSTYMSKTEADEFRLRINGKFGGLGMVIGAIDSNMVIRQVLEGFPADKAGLKIGDIILTVNGQSASGKPVDDILPMLRGAPSTTVMMKLQRPGNGKQFTVNMIREEIKLKSVPYYGLIADQIGYIKFTGFSQKCSDAIRLAILDMNSKQPMKGLVLDLRDNLGGLIDESIKISNIFLNQGDPIVRVKARRSDSIMYAKDSALLPLTPLVIITNKNTASASEVFTGAMADNDRAVVIGQKTYGKGLVGLLYDLQGGSILKLTVAHYYTPSGRCIQAKNYQGNGGSGMGIPDSLKNYFKTKNGRTVKDADGITPDLLLPSDDFPEIAFWLLDSNYIFKYASEYRQSHATIAPAAQFQLTEKDFNRFTHSLEGKNFAYQTVTEAKMTELLKTAEDEGYRQIMDDDVTRMKVKLNKEKQNDLIKYREIIQEILEEEIAARYYGEKGRGEAAVKKDPEIRAALNLINTPEEYRKILNH